jgi:hypothetical protein
MRREQVAPADPREPRERISTTAESVAWSERRTDVDPAGAVIRRPDAAPIVIAVHSSKDQQDADADDALISGAAKAAVAALGALG